MLYINSTQILHWMFYIYVKKHIKQTMKINTRNFSMCNIFCIFTQQRVYVPSIKYAPQLKPPTPHLYQLWKKIFFVDFYWKLSCKPPPSSPILWKCLNLVYLYKLYRIIEENCTRPNRLQIVLFFLFVAEKWKKKSVFLTINLQLILKKMFA